MLLREFELEDVPFILALLNSEGWLRYIGDRGIKTKEQAISYLENGPIRSYQVNGYGLGLVALKDTQEPIGMCGLLKRETLADTDIGFAFLPAYHGLGYAAEIAAATIQYGFETLNLNRIVAITQPDNTRSIKLLQKLGFRYERLLPAPQEKKEVKLFSLDASKTPL